MKNLYLQDIIQIINGKLINGYGNPLIKNVVINPKRINSNNILYFHLYKKKYANITSFQKYKDRVIITDNPDHFNMLKDHGIIVEVANIYKAFWKFINYYHGLFQIPVIGITGTCGKTTTKEMIKHILSTKYKVHSTYRSNNDVVLNLPYLLGIDDETEAAVFEMGVYNPGDLRTSCKTLMPQIRILLNIDVHHLKGCKTPEAYMKAKAGILEGLDPIKGVLILNGDDENIKKIDISKFKRIIYFGFSEQVHFQGKNIRYVEGGMTFTLKHQNQYYEVFVPGIGKHNVYNALAAMAAAWSAGMDINEARESLRTFKPVMEHLEVHAGIEGCTVIDDTWNNSPLSMAAALQVLYDISNSKKTIALLGYMPQLGESHYAMEQYAKIGEKVVETDVDLLIVVGEEAKEIGNKALELGMEKNKVYFSESGTEIYEKLEPLLKEKAIVLLKVTHRVMVKPSFIELKNRLIKSP